MNSPTQYSEAMTLFGNEMAPGESIVWVGQPETSVIFHKEDWFMIPFSLLWGGFALVWESFAIAGSSKASGFSWFFVLWGVPFVVIGQYMIWGRFLYAYYKKKRTFYALTNQRALMVVKGRSRGLTSVILRNTAAINCDVRDDGIGTITFGNSTRAGGDFFLQPKGSNRPQDPAFCDIADVETVYRMAISQRG